MSAQHNIIKSTAVVVGLSLASTGIALAADNLDSLSGNWPEANLRAQVNDGETTEVSIGDPIQMRFNADQDGYLAVAHIDADGETMVFFPASNKSAGPNLRAGEAIEFPRSADGFGMEAQLPLGDEKLYVVLSDSPITPADFGAAAGDVVISAGSTGPLDEQFAAVVNNARDRGRIAVTTLDYEIVSLAGDIQFTTRSIERYFAPDAPPTSAPKKIPLRINFAFDSTELTTVSRKNLDVFGQALTGEALTDRKFQLVGHTDNEGPDEYNLMLSRQRARSAADYLAQEYSIVPGRLEVKGLGESQPRKDNSTATGRSENRRVEFVEIRN